jgi:predicted DNA-binding protein YlxM (UPF0122 family)
LGIFSRGDMGRGRASEKILIRDGAERKYADRIDLLRNRADLLSGKDRVLMQMYLNNANSFYQMARLIGVNEANVARRINKLIKRLLDGQYITCLRNRDKLTEVQIEIARDYLNNGLPMRKIAQKFGISYYAVRQTMKQIQRLTSLA